MSSSSTPRTLSKGTLGLKFMNRNNAGHNNNHNASSGSATPSRPSTPAASTSAAVPVDGSVNSSATGLAQQAASTDVLGTTWTAGSGSHARGANVIYSTSLLDFPMLLSDSSTPHIANLNGRISFGGANKELEKDGDTGKVKAEASGKAIDKQAKAKKRKNVDLSQGARDRSTVPPKTKKARADDETTSFQRPAGFDGAKKKKNKDKAARANDDAPQPVRPSRDTTLRKNKHKDRDPSEVEPRYAARGETRNWDVGKDDADSNSASGSDSDSDDSLDFDLDEHADAALGRRREEEGDSSSDESDDDEVDQAIQASLQVHKKKAKKEERALQSSSKPSRNKQKGRLR